MRLVLFTRKTLRDCASPKLLLAFLVPYFGLAILLSVLFGEMVPDDIGSAPLFTQEQALVELYTQLSFVWLVAFPMVFIAVLSAVVVAGESERGTFRILLSKPVRRWEVLAGKFVGVTVFGFLSMLAGLLVGATALSVTTGVSPMALSGGVLTLLPGTLLYALFVATVVAAIGTLLGVLTGSRLKTMLLTLLFPVLFFAFISVKQLQIGDFYGRYFLYVPDVNYHLGNVYLLVQEAVGPGLNPETQTALATVSGVYDTSGTWHDPLLEGIVGTVPLAGHVSPVVSTVLLVGVTVVVLAGAFVQFNRMDIS